MKPQSLAVQHGLNSSFSIRQDVLPFFYNSWHYHPEIELVFIEGGSGTQFVGDNIQRFKNGDALLVGANLPHYWRCDDIHFQQPSEVYAEATVVHFLPDFWSSEFLELPENKKIKSLIQEAKRGIAISEKVKPEVNKYLKLLLNSHGTERIILLLEILSIIANDSNNVILSSVTFNNTNNMQQNEKDVINRIYAYSLANFKRRILHEEISEVAHISQNSFCRYFKTRTRKTFSRFLNELRVGFSCKLLNENKYTLTQICYDSGFNNPTNFHKCFKSVMGQTPYEYQKKKIVIANDSNKVMLSSVAFDKTNNIQQNEKDPINKIYAYSRENFKKRILLEEISEVAHVSPNSFCRYFKTRTRKTYSRFLNELRVGFSCKLLTENKTTLTQICYDSGFNNLSYFHKCFKSIMGKTPFEYQKNL
jgi:AraC-like DNA-binding protein